MRCIYAIKANEEGIGLYAFNPVLTDSTGCIDSDTQSQLPQLIGIIQSGAVVISPISTLMVETIIVKDVAAGKSSDALWADSMSLSTTE